MKTIVTRASMFPLTAFAFAAVGVGYVNLVFTLGTRWMMLAALALFLLWRGQLLLALRTPIAPALLAWLGWTLLTALWSDMPLLSLAKGVALSLTAIPLFSAGVYWTLYAKPNEPLSYLAPVTALALFTSIFGWANFERIGPGITVFVGLADNSNFLGSLLAISLPYPLYQACRAGAARANGFALGAGIAISLAIVGILILTRSRSAAIIAISILVGLALTTVARKTLIIGLSIIAIAVGTAALIPSIGQRIRDPLLLQVIKARGDDPLYSRRDLWRSSYHDALRGGVVGLGFGVSADSRLDFQGASSANGYTREKGSAPLATVEETGVVGLAISLLLTVGLLRFLLRRIPAIAEREKRVAAGLLAGGLVGVLLQSLFEAWWTAPGSIQSMFFWSTAGAATGVVRRARFDLADRAPQ